MGATAPEDETQRRITPTADITAYVLAHSEPASAVQRHLVERTRDAYPAHAGMQLAPEHGPLLTLLVRLVGARRAIEVGTFTGYSSLAIAAALPPDGRLLCCDLSERATALACEAWRRAEVQERVELRLGPALATLRTLPDEPLFDFAFVDADKTGYPAYYDELVLRTRAGGLLIFDNTLLGGRVLEPVDDDAVAMAELNARLVADERVEVVMLPVADGLSLVRRR